MEFDTPYTANEILSLLGLKSKETLRKNYLNPAICDGFVVMTQPDKPNSRNQRYIKNRLLNMHFLIFKKCIFCAFSSVLNLSYKKNLLYQDIIIVLSNLKPDLYFSYQMTHYHY